MINLKNIQYCYGINDIPLDRGLYTQNIIDCYGRTSADIKRAGMVWYPEANQQVLDLAALYRWPVPMAQAAAALLTQMVRWEVTVAALTNLMAGVPVAEIGHPNHRTLAPKLAGIRADPDHAIKYLGTGLKIPGFFHSLISLGQTLQACIDRWAARVALNFRIDSVEGKALYRFLESCYQEAARILGLWPAQLQAITWVQKRNEWKGKPKHIFAAPRVTV